MGEDQHLLSLMTRRERVMYRRANPESLSGRIARSTIEMSVRSRTLPEAEPVAP